MERATKIDKKRFLREVDFLNNKLSEMYAGLNRAMNDLGIVERETDNKQKELHDAVDELNKITIETEKSRKSKEDYDKALVGGNDILLNLNNEIISAQIKLKDLIDNIDSQIEINKIKEQEALKDVREKKRKVLEDLENLNKELSDKSAGNTTLSIENHELEERIKEKKQEFDNFSKEMDRQRKDIEDKNRGLDSRDAYSSEREKKLDFYNKRIQRMATKLNIQLKEI